MTTLDCGMLWFDNNKKASLDEKIERAVNYYQKKYGQQPNTCHLHPDTRGKRRKVNGIKLVGDKYVGKTHMLIGVCNVRPPKG